MWVVMKCVFPSMYIGISSVQFWTICSYIYTHVQRNLPYTTATYSTKSVSRGSLQLIISVLKNRYSSSVPMIFPFCKCIEHINVFRSASLVPIWKFYMNSISSKPLSDTQTTSTPWVMTHVLCFPSSFLQQSKRQKSLQQTQILTVSIKGQKHEHDSKMVIFPSNKKWFYILSPNQHLDKLEKWVHKN